MPFWIKDGKVVMLNGRVVICDECPCPGAVPGEPCECCEGITRRRLLLTIAGVDCPEWNTTFALKQDVDDFPQNPCRWIPEDPGAVPTGYTIEAFQGCGGAEPSFFTVSVESLSPFNGAVWRKETDPGSDHGGDGFSDCNADPGDIPLDSSFGTACDFSAATASGAWVD